MSKKIMILFASPNPRGNTRHLLDWIKEGACQAGASIEEIDAGRLQYKSNGCRACMECQKSERYECVIQDEASAVIARIPQADIVIFATPLYFFGPSAQLKLCMDRMYSLFKFSREHSIKHTMGHMKFVLVSSAGGETFKPLLEMFIVLTKFANVAFEKLLVSFAGQSGDIVKIDGIKGKAAAFGRKIVIENNQGNRFS